MGIILKCKSKMPLKWSSKSSCSWNWFVPFCTYNHTYKAMHCLHPFDLYNYVWCMWFHDSNHARPEYNSKNNCLLLGSLVFNYKSKSRSLTEIALNLIADLDFWKLKRVIAGHVSTNLFSHFLNCNL